ncbi:hypothetical protein FD755_021958 [Muntiacus reevesi]|uniref:Activator of basal transcription 1 n=1 Tax=Muntiacus reevesi TaxID=9886 RepID=A0A5N3W1X6_MUNRE|nr:hypothetical protein FD755_021958 [Muntiacus reevesi]
MEAEGLEPGAAELGPLEGSDQKLGAEEEQEESEEAAGGSKERVVPGIVYLGHIPPRFRPLHVRNLLSAYGEVGRVFSQAENGFSKDYTEGWVEFRDKRVAELVAASLHNTPMGSRRRSPFRYDLWNLKHLHRLRLPRPSVRLTSIFVRSVERGQRFLAPDGDSTRPNGSWAFAQRPTEQGLRARKAARPEGRERARLANAQDQARSNRGLLAKIFGALHPQRAGRTPHWSGTLEGHRGPFHLLAQPSVLSTL